MKFRIIFWLVVILLAGCDIKFQDSQTGILTERPIRLTKDSFVKSEPAWSPDGSKIAYSKAMTSLAFSTFTLDGSPERSLGRIFANIANEYALSPDGRQLVFPNSDGARLWLADLTSTNEPIQIVSNQSNIANPAWSADGNHIAISARSPGSIQKIWIVSPGGGTLEQVSFGEESNDFNPSWSPDGAALVFEERGPGPAVIQRLQLSDSSLVQLTADSLDSRDPAWSPAGNEIAFTLLGNGAPGVWVVPDAGGTPIQVSTSAATADRPAWSFDGSRLAFRGPDGIWVVSNTGDVLSITDLQEPYPVWAADQTELVKTDEVDNRIIEVLSLDDSTTTALTKVEDFQDDFSPCWFPDNRTLAFVRRFQTQTTFRQTIWSLQIPNGSPRPMFGNADRIGFENNPAISPDGSLLAFDSGSRMFLALLESKEVAELTSFIGGGLSEASWSPAGTGFVCNATRDLKVFKTDSSLVVQEQVIPGGVLRNPDWSNPHPVFGENIAVERGNNIAFFSFETNTTQTAVTNARWPTWSPDGSSLAFVLNDQVYATKILLNLPGE